MLDGIWHTGKSSFITLRNAVPGGSHHWKPWRPETWEDYLVTGITLESVVFPDQKGIRSDTLLVTRF